MKMLLGDLERELKARGAVQVRHGGRWAWQLPNGAKIPCRLGHNTTKDVVTANEMFAIAEKLASAGLPPLAVMTRRPAAVTPLRDGREAVVESRPTNIWQALVARWRRARGVV